MKISIAWIFDHIDADWRTIDIESLVATFNRTTAEIENWHTLNVDVDTVSVAQVKKIDEEVVVMHSHEWGADITLPKRSDLVEKAWFIIARDKNTYRWATGADFGRKDKIKFLPAVFVGDTDQKGNWKKSIEKTDYILDIDNKSITHRPDLWGHRGLAREVAALLNLRLKPLDEFLAKKEIQHVVSHASTPHEPFAMSIETKKCARLAGLYINEINIRPSLIWMVSRLSRVDAGAIDSIVDSTNYVMLDISQPMHAFDADTIPNKSIVVRQAKNKAQLTLLDNQTIELHDEDIIIADNGQPLSLAGIMGGKLTGVSRATQALFVESAHFDPSSIRISAIRHKIRTQASARFEKNVDPNQNIDSILRFLFLLESNAIPFKALGAIVSCGIAAKPLTLDISHSFIESRLGTTLASDFIITTLHKLGFGVTFKKIDNSLMYTIIIPTFRATKDVHLKEDIVEEIGRFFGYENITPVVPRLPLKPTDMHVVHRVRAMKYQLAFGLHMKEVENYAFYDESFLRELSWQPNNCITLKNPVSENWQKLVTSLVPHLLKAIKENCANYDQLQFFEWARVWEQSATVVEAKKLSGMFFNKHEAIDFYASKSKLVSLFDMIKLPVTFQAIQTPTDPWYAPYQTAYIIHEGQKIGVAGKADVSLLSRVSEGDAFIFELDGDFLAHYRSPLVSFKPLSKYPDVERDVSILVPLAITVDQVITLISQANKYIVSVVSIDFFAKEEWNNQKALTFRLIIRDNNKTMTKEEVDQVFDSVIQVLQHCGATIR